MRLLEFDRVDDGAESQQTAHIGAPIMDLAKSATNRVYSAQQPANSANTAARVFPVKAPSVVTPARRGPIDLENLQQRIVALEKRIKKRAENNPATLSTPELDQLKQRMLILERNVNSELWAAKQREYTLLEMLAQPPLVARIGQRITRIKTHNLPAIGRWLKTASREWWLDRQPQWWPKFAQAWQESLDKARDF